MVLNQSLVGILRLFIAYEWQETLTRDEFDALSHYQHTGYGLMSESVYEGDNPLWDDAPEILCQQVRAVGNGERIFYYLVKEGE
jgi:hypothetical protein